MPHHSRRGTAAAFHAIDHAGNVPNFPRPRNAAGCCRAKLAGELRGDLDWLVMKALEKDRARRYDTAAALAEDIQRHLANEPILARPPSAIYRLQKMARRNKRVFTAAAAVTFALVAGMAISTAMFFREKQERELWNSGRIFRT